MALFPKIRPKYGNRKTVVDGLTFDSVKEARRWSQLRLLERAGAISGLERQVAYEVIPKCDGERAAVYIVDFRYKEGDRLVCEDVKGVKTDAYRLKRKLMNWRFGIKIRET